MFCYVDQSICIKCGQCEGKMFKIDNMGNYQFILPEIEDKYKDAIRAIENKCPANAIIVEE